MNGHHEKLGQNPRSWSKPRDSIPSNGQASPNGKITLNPHVAHMWITCVHMCPTCVVPSSHFYPHVVKNFHMWNTCEVEQTHVYIVCLACDTQEPTCDYMWGSCGLLSLSITLTFGKNMWNWNNTQNPHVNFMWFFRMGGSEGIFRPSSYLH